MSVSSVAVGCRSSALQRCCRKCVRSSLVRPPLHQLSIGCPRPAGAKCGAQQEGRHISTEPSSSSSRNVATAAAVEEREKDQERELVALEAQAEKEAKYGWLAFWVASAVAFGIGIWATEGPVKAQEFFAGACKAQAGAGLASDQVTGRSAATAATPGCYCMVVRAVHVCACPVAWLHAAVWAVRLRPRPHMWRFAVGAWGSLRHTERSMHSCLK